MEEMSERKEENCPKKNADAVQSSKNGSAANVHNPKKATSASYVEMNSSSSLPSPSISSSSTASRKAEINLMNSIDSLAQGLESFKSSIEKVKTLNVGGIVYLDGMLDLCINLSELLEQLCTYGRNHIKVHTEFQLKLILTNIQAFDKLVSGYLNGGKSFVKGSKSFPFVKFSSSGSKQVSANISDSKCGDSDDNRSEGTGEKAVVKADSKAVLIFAKLIESLFMARLIIIEIQFDVMNDDAVNHDEQVNRMEILIHTISKIDAAKDDSQDEILVCIGLLDNFACNYFKVYGGEESGNEVGKITKSVWEMEKSLSYGRKSNGSNRKACVDGMQKIMNRVKLMSASKSESSNQKLKNKLKMIVSAREQELKAWKDLEEKVFLSTITDFPARI